MSDLLLLDAPPDPMAAGRRRSLLGGIRAVARLVGSASEWIFGLTALLLGLSILAALPVAQFLSLGYLLEASGRVARSGRLRDGLIGVRKAARVGGVIAGAWLATRPAWMVRSYARSAELIDPGGPVARSWRAAALVLAVLTVMHIAAACLRGGRFRLFLWPLGHPSWLVRRLRRGGLYVEARDGLWAFRESLRLPYYFRLGLVGFFGTLAWIVPPVLLIAAGSRFPLLGLLGALALAVVVPFLPFLQVRYAIEGRAAALFAPRAVRDQFRRAPWAFAFSLMVLLLAAIPLYVLKIEMIPREAAWLPSLVFIAFLAPARLLTGWAYARSLRRDRPRHWFFRILGRAAIVPAAAFYVLVVFISQYIGWDGVGGLYEQHAFLLPVPFLAM
ncbi:hypothetical protein TA3x_002428 [Tundrisphaera sp. TA3]|uniref:hypothetical protein n=1 Tax=Tundrisphaera sp. TA3 TaxID=3435775 RepID=UPI003EBAA956